MLRALTVLVILIAAPPAIAQPGFQVGVKSMARFARPPGSTAEVEFLPFFWWVETPAFGEGLEAFELSLRVVGGTLRSAALDGTPIPTAFDHDGDPSTPPIDPDSITAEQAPLHLIEEASGDYLGSPVPGARGVVISVDLDPQGRREYLEMEVLRMGRIVLEVEIPAGSCGGATVFPVDGLKGSGEPVENRMRLGGVWRPAFIQHIPTTEACASDPRFDISVVPVDLHVEPAPGGDLISRPEVVIQDDGSFELDFDVEVRLASRTGTPDGPGGWSLSLYQDDRLTLLEVSVKGLVVDTLHDDDDDPGTAPIDLPLDLGEAAFRVSEPGLCPGRSQPVVQGALSAVVLDVIRLRTLHGDSGEQILRLRYRWNAPLALGENEERRIRFGDGMLGSGTPVQNVITYRGASFRPSFHDLVILPIGIPHQVDEFIRGDSNGDGRLDIADAVRVVNAVVPGLGPPLPCRDAGDSNDDGRLDLPDAIHIIDHQFRGGPAPAAPFPGCGPGEDSTPETCPPGSAGWCSP